MTSVPSMHGCTPADLQNMGMTALFLLRDAPTELPRSADSPSALECGGSTPLSTPTEASASSIEEPASEGSTLTPLAPNPKKLVNRTSQIVNPDTLTPSNLNAPAPCCSALSVPSVVKSGSRSKIARLPKDIQENLNTMLASGRPYADIIRNLNDHGYPGFNKVNLHDWKVTGFQDWCRTENRQSPSEGAQTVLVTGRR